MVPGAKDFLDKVRRLPNALIVKKLLSAGADKDLRDDQGASALDYAQKAGENAEISRLLKTPVTGRGRQNAR